MLIKPAFSSLRLAHISLTCVGLMWVLPFLCPRHAYPITTFFQEWGAAALGLCAMPLLITQRYWQQPAIPRIVLLPIGLMLLVLVQFAAGKIGYFSQTLLFTLYLLWAALLIMLGQRLREEFGLPMLAAALAGFLLLGAELSAFIGVLQHYHWHTFLDGMVAANKKPAIYGNMGQPNHFANYISLGLISLGLLRLHRQLRAWQTVLLAVPLLFVLVLSGSRSAWLYLLCMAGLAFLWQRRDKSFLPLLYYSLLLTLGFGLMHFVVQLPLFSGFLGNVTTVGRMMEAASGIVGSSQTSTDLIAAAGSGMGERSIRLYLWQEAWLIFTHFPLLGAGLGQFAWQHFLLGPSLHNVNITGLYNNSHNLVMEIAAEMGLAGLLTLFGTLGLWIRQISSLPRTIYHWWGCGLLIVLAIHSLLEYPLWYAYFLGIAALTLGIFDGVSYRLELRKLGRLSVVSILLLGTLSLLQVWQGYRGLENLVSMQRGPTSDEALRKDLLEAHKQALLQPYVEVAMSGMIELRADNLANVRVLNEEVMHFVPISSAVYREVYLLVLAGEQAAAQAQMERAIWCYPDGFQAEREKLRSLASKDPGHFAALLEFALQKYEERQRAVLAR